MKKSNLWKATFPNCERKEIFYLNDWRKMGATKQPKNECNFWEEVKSSIDDVIESRYFPTSAAAPTPHLHYTKYI